MNKRRIVAIFFTAVLCLAPFAPPADSDDREDKRRRARSSEPDMQQDQVLEALRRKEIRPLADIQAAAEKAVPGQVVGVEIKRRGAKFIYELKIIAARGRLREIYVDAATLDILKIE